MLAKLRVLHVNKKSTEQLYLMKSRECQSLQIQNEAAETEQLELERTTEETGRVVASDLCGAGATHFVLTQALMRRWLNYSTAVSNWFRMR